MKNQLKLVLITVLVLLTISFQAFAQNGDNSLKTTVSDSLITARIKSQFVGNHTTKATSINVETIGGVVKLTGIVDSELEASTAVQIAQSTPGVKEVDAQNLYVKKIAQKSEKPTRDIYITAKIRGILIRENLINGQEFPDNKITVETQNGIVYLSGQVENDEQLKRSIVLTESISGVKRVVSRIIIASD